MTDLTNFSELVCVILICIWKIGVPLYNLIISLIRKDEQWLSLFLLSIFFPLIVLAWIVLLNDMPEETQKFDWELAELIAKEKLEEIQTHRVPYSSDVCPFKDIRVISKDFLESV